MTIALTYNHNQSKFQTHPVFLHINASKARHVRHYRAVPVPCALQSEREAAIRDFASRVVRVLVATDVASRGLDIKGIGHVVNMDLPKQFEVN